jgi:hypothetical protein
LPSPATAGGIWNHRFAVTAERLLRSDDLTETADGHGHLVFGDIAETEEETVARGAGGVAGRERPEPEFVLGGTGGEGYVTHTAAG